MPCPIIFLRIGRVPRPPIAAHLEVMAIFRELLHSSPLALPRAAWLARWLASVFRFTGSRDGNSLAAAQPAQAPYTRALSPLSPAIQSIAAMRASPNYVLAALYLLGDANVQRSRCVQDRECRRSSAQQERWSKLELDELILQEQPRALRLFLEVVLCGKRAS